MGRETTKSQRAPRGWRREESGRSSERLCCGARRRLSLLRSFPWRRRLPKLIERDEPGHRVRFARRGGGWTFRAGGAAARDLLSQQRTPGAPCQPACRGGDTDSSGEKLRVHKFQYDAFDRATRIAKPQAMIKRRLRLR